MWLVKCWLTHISQENDKGHDTQQDGPAISRHYRNWIFFQLGFDISSPQLPSPTTDIACQMIFLVGNPTQVIKVRIPIVEK